MEIIIFGSFHGNNKGDEAILQSMLKQLGALFVNAQFTVPSQNPSYIRKTYNVKSFKFQSILAIIFSVFKSDLVILGGGGIIYDINYHTLFNYKKCQLLFWLGFVLIAKIFQKTVVYYAIEVGPLETFLGRFLTKKISNSVDLIIVRNSRSIENLYASGITKPPIVLTSDSALTLQPINSTTSQRILINEYFHSSNNSHLVGISVRRSRFMVDEKLISIFSKLSDYLIETFDVDIAFIPMNINDDRTLSEKVIANVKNSNRVFLINGNHTPSELMGLIGEMDMVLCMRLHSLILSTCMNVPSVGFCYDPKIKSYLNSINQELNSIYLSISPNNRVEVDLSACEKILSHVWINRENVKRTLKPNVDMQKEKSQESALLVKELMDL